MNPPEAQLPRKQEHAHRWTWRDILLTNRELLSVALGLSACHLVDPREHLASAELETDFDAANELYRLLRSL